MDSFGDIFPTKSFLEKKVLACIISRELMVNRSLFTDGQQVTIHWWSTGHYSLMVNRSLFTDGQQVTIHWWSTGHYSLMVNRSLFTDGQQVTIHWWSTGHYVPLRHQTCSNGSPYHLHLLPIQSFTEWPLLYLQKCKYNLTCKLQ